MHSVLKRLGCLAVLVGSVALSAGAETQQGVLRILADGEVLGSESYEIVASGAEVQARATVTFRMGGDTVEQTSRLLLNPDLSPRRYEWKMASPREAWLGVTFDAGRATIRFPREDGREEEQKFDFGAARVAVLDNNVFHHFLLLSRLYDLDRGGPQEIQVFIPQSVQPGTVKIELEEVEMLAVAGQLQPVRRFTISSADNLVLLWVSESGVFVRLQVPQANVEVVPESAEN